MKNKIRDIGVKYLGLDLSKLIKLINLHLSLSLQNILEIKYIGAKYL